MSKGKIKYVFTSSHTKDGFFTFIPDLIRGLRRVYILKGPAGSGKSTLIRLLGETMYEQGYEIEFWISAIDPLNADGVYITQLDTAVINGSLPNPIDPFYPGGIGEIINLGDYIDKDATVARRTEIEKIIADIAAKSKGAYYLLKKASVVREEIKRAATKHLNMSKIKGLIDDLAEEILGDQPQEKHYFASALTSDGMINYIDSLSAQCQKRYLLIGPGGTAKSTVIAELASVFKDKGLVLEYYHSGFDVESLQMVIIKNLQIALVDGGNVELKIKPGDVVIDMSMFLDNYEADAAEILISEARRNFETMMLEAQAGLDGVHSSIKGLKRVYAAGMDFEGLDEKREELRIKIIN